MKSLRFIITLLVLALILVFSLACAEPELKVIEQVEEEPVVVEEPVPEESIEVVKEEAGKPEVEEQAVEVGKGIFSVEITLPAALFEGEDINEVVAKAKENGISEVTVNNDGSITYRMSKSKHNELMREIKDGLLEYIEEIKSSEDYISIKDITHNKTFSELTLVVDQEKFENSFDGFAALGLGITSLYYQLFNGVSPYKVTIFFKNAETGEIFNKVIYPEAFED